MPYYLLGGFILLSGTKHFLLMCNVRAEDSGEIKFVARHIDSVAYLDVEGIINILLDVPNTVCMNLWKLMMQLLLSFNYQFIRFG